MAEPADRLIVRYAPGTDSAERAEVRREAGVERDERLPGPLELVDPDGPLREALAELRSDPDVLYAEPDDARVAFRTAPDDRFFRAQWGLENTGQIIGGSGGTPGADIAATEAWEVTTGSDAARVAVLDTGVDAAHPDLAPNLEEGFDYVETDPIPQDEDGHGTHVTGTVGALGNDATGVTGVAWRASLIPFRVLGADGAGDVSDAIQAYAAAGRAGARVVNLSLGGDSASRAERDAIAALPNVLFVAAAGNEGLDNDQAASYPCEYELRNVVCVAASDRDDNLASFSNFGATSVDLAAPGVRIASTYPAGEYALLDGTSMAAPHVSGVAALLLSREPQASVSALRDALLTGAEPRPGLAGRVVTGARLDAPGALRRLGELLGPPPSPPPPPAAQEEQPPAGEPAPSAPAQPTPTPAPAEEPPTGASGVTPPQPVDRSAPWARITATPRSSLRTLRTRRTVRVRIACAEACRATSRLLRGRRQLARRVSARLLTTRTVTLRVPAAEVRRLRGARRATLTVRAVLRDRLGNTRTEVVRLRLSR